MVVAVAAAALLAVGCAGATDDLRQLLGLDGADDAAEGVDGADAAGTGDGEGAAAAEGFDEELECEREGFPCTWGEVDPSHLDATAEVADELTALTEDGWDPEAVADHLGARDEVVDAVVGTTSVRFRLEGARPMWVLAEDTLVQDEEALAADGVAAPGTATGQDATPVALRAPDPGTATGQDTTPVALRGPDPGTAGVVDATPVALRGPDPGTATGQDATPVALRAPDTDAGPGGGGTGEGSTGDGFTADGAPHADGPVAATPAGVVGDDPASKSALLLGIYDHEPLFWGTDEVAELLGATRGYEGGVEVLRNAARDDRVIGPEHFMGWDAYDVVYVATHGDQLCDGDGRCWTALSLGAEILETSQARDDRDVLRAYGAAYADHPGVALARSGNRVLPVIDGGWLATHYAGQLDDTLVYVQACSSGRAGDLAAGLAGGSSVFFGWSNTALADQAGAAAVRLFEELTTRGVASETAFEEVRAAGLDVNQGTYTRPLAEVGPGQATHRYVDGELVEVTHTETQEIDARLLHHAPGIDQRVREVIELQDPVTGEELVDGAEVVVSRAGDGAGGAGGSDGGGDRELPVRLEVDGVLDGEEGAFDIELVANGVTVGEWNLTEGELVTDETWRIEDEVTLPVDLADDGDLTLDARTTLPEGGTSQHVVDVVIPDLVLHLDVDLDVDIPTGFQEQVRVTGTIPLTAEDAPDTWSGRPEPGWSTYDHWFSECPEAAGVLDVAIDLDVPRVTVDREEGVAEVELRLAQASGGPTITCAGRDFEVHLSGQEVIFTSLLVAEGVTPGPGVGDMPAELDMVEPGWVRLELEATDGPSTFVYRAGDTASTSEWDMTGEVELRLEPGDGS